ncbi:DNA-directed RNA polymerase sigma-70 factor OS=Streptomyces paromomycinus OX=92743 GN=rpoE_2 PE=3 SV=1 [Streptomyces rimosus subsp. rimosus]
MPEPSDALLAVRAGEGDEGAFEVLVRRHSAQLLRLATRLLGSRTDAEDAVQDAFVSAWRRIPEFRGDAAFATWMYRIVTNRCLNLLRTRKPLTQDLGSVPEPTAPEHASSPVRAAESTAAVEALTRAMDGLTPEQRACWRGAARTARPAVRGDRRRGGHQPPGGPWRGFEHAAI